MIISASMAEESNLEYNHWDNYVQHLQDGDNMDRDTGNIPITINSIKQIQTVPHKPIFSPP